MVTPSQEAMNVSSPCLPLFLWTAFHLLQTDNGFNPKFDTQQCYFNLLSHYSIVCVLHCYLKYTCCIGNPEPYFSFFLFHSFFVKTSPARSDLCVLQAEDRMYAAHFDIYICVVGHFCSIFTKALIFCNEQLQNFCLPTAEESCSTPAF